MSQSSVGAPLTRGFVSAVERGRTVPSIAALALLVDRLDVPLDDFFRGVKDEMTVMYNPGHERHEDAASRRGR